MKWSPKWLGVALVASLGLNLFVLSTWVGRVVLHRDKVETEQVTLGPITDALSPEGRRLMREAMRAKHKEAVMLVRKLYESIDRATRALDADPYDPEAYKAALHGIRTYSDEGRALLHATLVNVVGRLSPADRHRLAQEIRRQQELQRRRSSRRGDGKPLRKAVPPPPPPPAN